MNTPDIIIAGAGLAGLSAAHELRSRFPDVRVLVVSEHTPISTHVMGFSAPVNPPDSPECFEQDTAKLGNFRATRELVHTLATRALPELRRLEQLGIQFDKNASGEYDCVKAVGSTFPRVVHHGTDTGRQILQRLQTDVTPGRITQLILHDNAVKAVVINAQQVIPARAVILATGGACGLWNFATWNHFADGSGLAAAVNAGAETENLSTVQFEPTVVFFPSDAQGSPIITTLLNDGAQLLDKDGRNIITSPDMMTSKRAIASAIQNAIDDGRALPDGSVLYDLSLVDREMFKTKYAGYLMRYKALSVSQDELRFHVRPAAHTTLGGLRINAQAATSIAGLFAAGEITGSIHGDDRLGGNAGLETLVFGRIAAQSAADFIAHHPSAPSPAELPPLIPFPSDDDMAALRDILTSAITIRPLPENIHKAQAKLAALKTNLFTNLVTQILAHAEAKLQNQ